MTRDEVIRQAEQYIDGGLRKGIPLVVWARSKDLWPSDVAAIRAEATRMVEALKHVAVARMTARPVA